MGTSSNSKILRISELKKTEKKTPPQKHLRDQQDGQSPKLPVQPLLQMRALNHDFTCLAKAH